MEKLSTRFVALKATTKAGGLQKQKLKRGRKRAAGPDVQINRGKTQQGGKRNSHQMGQGGPAKGRLGPLGVYHWYQRLGKRDELAQLGTTRVSECFLGEGVGRVCPVEQRGKKRLAGSRKAKRKLIGRDRSKL